VRSPFERFSRARIVDAIGEGWGLDGVELRYVPLGAGAYHWAATTGSHERYFVTCDDLDTKPWLGSDRDSVFHGLQGAYATASQLRSAGLEFVVAPIATIAGEVAERIDERHSLSVFEHIEGQPGQWGESLETVGRADVVTMLARLHQTPAGGHTIAERPFVVPDRAGLEEALADLHRPWTGGPLSEAVRRELVAHADAVSSLFEELDRFAAATTSSGARLVVTHGEPHPGNLIRTGDGLAMVDWDTVALATPERDLWMLADDESLIADYERLTGLAVDRRALTAHRLMWSLTDLAAYSLQLRNEHEAGADSDRALAAVRSILGGEQPTPYGFVSPPPCPG